MVGFGWFLFLGGGVWVVCWLILLGCGGGGGEGRCGWDTRRLNLSSIELETLLLRVASGLVRFSLLGWGCGGGWLDLWLVSSLVGGGGTFGGGGGWCGVCLWLKSGFRGLFGITEDRVVGGGGGGWSCWLRLGGCICVGGGGGWWSELGSGSGWLLVLGLGVTELKLRLFLSGILATKDGSIGGFLDSAWLTLLPTTVGI